jgi:hypothetical protein
MGEICRAFGRFLCPNVLFMQISPVVDVAVCLSSTSKDVLLILTHSQCQFIRRYCSRCQVDARCLVQNILKIVQQHAADRSKLECLKKGKGRLSQSSILRVTVRVISQIRLSLTNTIRIKLSA